MVDWLLWVGLMNQKFVVATEFLDEVTKISKAWYTHEDYTLFAKRGISKEQLTKEKE